MFSRILLSRFNLLEDLCTWAVMITHYSKHEVKPKYGRTINSLVPCRPAYKNTKRTPYTQPCCAASLKKTEHC